MTIAFPNCLAKDVRIHPIIVAELELGNIERRIFPAHLVERADDATLDNRPEAFNGLSMDCTDDILSSSVVNYAVRIFLAETIVARPLGQCKAN